VGSLGCFGWLVRLVFWALLLSGRDELGPRWTWGLALLWVAVWWLCSLIPGGTHLFTSLVALTDIVLVLVVFGGDVRIT
jgi:hypothetical protein